MNDVFISYAHIDDQPLTEGQKGWISQFHRCLGVRLAQLLGQEAKVWRDPKLQGSDMFDVRLVREFLDSKVMVSVLTPRYVKSDWCVKEVEEFSRLAEERGGLQVGDKSRVFKVVKTPVPTEEMPSPLHTLFSRLLGFEFFEVDPETGRLREFDETFGPTARQRYFERVYDLAYEICQVLKAFSPGARQLGLSPLDNTLSGKSVFLATTTSDLVAERDCLRRELTERGCGVLPDSPLPVNLRDFEDTVLHELEQCQVSVHFLGRHYGITPEDSPKSLPEIQLELSARRAQAGSLARWIWTPERLQPVDPRQGALLERLAGEAGFRGMAEWFEGDLFSLRRELIRKLAGEKQPVPTGPGEAHPDTGPPCVYLLFSEEDKAVSGALEDLLFEAGFEVFLPSFDANVAAGQTLHRENLACCDAVLVYFGSVPRTWVDIKLREILKATGYGRPAPIPIQAVYAGPPFEESKQRFHSHQAQVIHPQSEAYQVGDLRAFIEAVRKIRRHDG